MDVRKEDKTLSPTQQKHVVNTSQCCTTTGPTLVFKVILATTV